MPSTSIPGPLPPDISRATEYLIVRWLTASIAVLLVSLRFYVRGILRKNLGWDDYTSLLALAFSLAQSIVSIFQVESGFGRNIQYLTPAQIQGFGLYTDICVMLFIVGTALVRVSVCLFLHRVVPASKMSYRRWIWGLGIFCTLVSLASFLVQCLQCIPFPGLWDQDAHARCIPQADMMRIAKVQGGSAVITDFLCVLLPMLVFRNLQVSLRDKLAIYITIGLGFFTAVTAIARTSIVDLSTENPTWNLIPVAIWASLEQNVGIIVASMPAVQQLVTIRKRPFRRHPAAAFCNHDNINARPPLNPFAKLPDSDLIGLPNDDSFTETSSREPSPPRQQTGNLGNYQDPRASLIRLSTASPPLWTDRKISLAETVEMSRVYPSPTFVERKASSTEKVKLSLVTPSWGHRKTSSADTVDTLRYKRLSMVSPLSLDRPPYRFPAARPQQLGKFEETGLRHSKVATPEEMSAGNLAVMGYSCKCEGGTSKGTPKTSPKLGPW